MQKATLVQIRTRTYAERIGWPNSSCNGLGKHVYFTTMSVKGWQPSYTKPAFCENMHDSIDQFFKGDAWHAESVNNHRRQNGGRHRSNGRAEQRMVWPSALLYIMFGTGPVCSQEHAKKT